MKLIKEFEVLYFKLPEKKRNLRQDGIFKMFENYASVVIALYDENAVELMRKNLPASSTNYTCGDSATIGQYVVEFGDEIGGSDEHFAHEHSKPIPLGIPKPKTLSVHEPSMNIVNRPMKQFIDPTEKCEEESAHSSSSLTSISTFKPLKSIKQTTAAAKPSIVHSTLQSNKAREAPESKVYSLDNALRKRMRAHQISAVEWMLERLDISKMIQNFGSRSTSIGSKSFPDLDFAVSSDDDDDFIDAKPSKTISKGIVDETRDQDVKGVILADEVSLPQSTL
jgi:hypothetical protein